MTRQFIRLGLFLSLMLVLSGCQGLWYLYLNCVVDIGPDRFVIEENNREVSVPIYSSHSLKVPSEEAEYLLVIIHGAGLNAGNSFKTGVRLAHKLFLTEGRFWVISPQFLEGISPEESEILIWDNRWREGGLSVVTEQNTDLPLFSSFTVQDRLIEHVLRRNSGINHVYIIGHSAGGQFVSRYAAMNQEHKIWSNRGVTIRYVVANPSSYMYLDEVRFQTDANSTIRQIPIQRLQDCEGYNRYKYGLKERYGYAASLKEQEIVTQLSARSVIFLLGMEDVKRGWSLDKSCEVEMQGENRFERGLLYRHHLSSVLHRSNHHWLLIPEVGHDADQIFTNDLFIKKLKTLDF